MLAVLVIGMGKMIVLRRVIRDIMMMKMEVVVRMLLLKHHSTNALFFVSKIDLTYCKIMIISSSFLQQQCNKKVEIE